MCDQIPIQVCRQLTPEELMSLELLQCERRNVEPNSTLLTFLLDTVKGNHPFATKDERIVIGMELLRIGWEIEEDYHPDAPKLTSKDIIWLGYGCSHAAA